MSPAKSTSKKPRKTYRKPEIKKFGSVKDLTKTDSTGAAGDVGAFPKMHCISVPPRIYEHQLLLSDHRCQASYQEAINRAVKPGDVVVDLGTGSGIHALFAARAGARKIYAIDSDPFLQVAREVIHANGFGDKVEFIYGDSRQIELPEQADIVISNIGFLYSLKCLPDAHRRFLKQGGRMLPSGLQISLVPYTDQAFYDSQIKMWDKEIFGLSFSALKKLAVHHPHYTQLTPGAYLAAPQDAPLIDLSLSSAAKASFHMEFVVSKAGSMHALGGWYRFFDGSDVLVSTEPPLQLNGELWSNFILPLEKPMDLKVGDKVSCEISMDFETLSDSSLWSWTVEHNSNVAQKQNSFNSLLVPHPSVN